MNTLEVAKLNEIPEGGMKRIVVNGTAILLSNVAGKIYATSDRCGHENASLSRGTLESDVVTCPLHGAEFDVKTGRNLLGPQQRSMPPELLQRIPPEFIAMMQKTAEITADIEVKSLDVFKVEVRGESVYLDVQGSRIG